jgi:O-antigen/teichoic acid export membrane protein
VLNAAAVIGLFLLDALDLRSALLASVVAVVLADVVALIVAKAPRPVLHWPVVRRVWSFGVRGWVGTLSSTMTSRLDQVLLVGLAPAAELGRYAVAVSAANVTIPIGQGAASALLPQLRRGGLARGRDVARAAAAVAVTAGVVAITVAVGAPAVLPALFGEAFRGALAPLLILLPGQVAAAVADLLRADLAARGHPGQSSLCQGVAAVVTVVLIIPAVRLHGIVGAAWVTTAAYVAMAVTAGVLARQLHATGPEVLDAS